MNYLTCLRCPNTGKVGDMTLRRDGTVPGTQNMPRYVAICPDCIRTENTEKKANEYERATSGA